MGDAIIAGEDVYVGSHNTKINYNNDRQNKSRIPYAYSVGDMAYLLKDILVSKNNIDCEGPYEIIDVGTNGTVNICHGPDIQTINVRCLVLCL